MWINTVVKKKRSNSISVNNLILVFLYDKPRANCYKSTRRRKTTKTSIFPVKLNQLAVCKQSNKVKVSCKTCVYNTHIYMFQDVYINLRQMVIFEMHVTYKCLRPHRQSRIRYKDKYKMSGSHSMKSIWTHLLFLKTRQKNQRMKKWHFWHEFHHWKSPTSLTRIWSDICPLFSLLWDSLDSV